MRPNNLAFSHGFGITKEYEHRIPKATKLMSGPGYLTIYSILVLLFSMLGGYLPFIGGRVSHSRLQLYLSISAGVMLGASFFHVMPEAMQLSGDYFGWWMSLGVVGLFCIERFIAPHSHEVDGGGHHHHHEEGHVHKHE